MIACICSNKFPSFTYWVNKLLILILLMLFIGKQYYQDGNARYKPHLKSDLTFSFKLQRNDPNLLIFSSVGEISWIWSFKKIFKFL